MKPEHYNHIKEALALMNSMIDCGEYHTNTSRAALARAFDALKAASSAPVEQAASAESAQHVARTGIVYEWLETVVRAGKGGPAQAASLLLQQSRDPKGPYTSQAAPVTVPNGWKLVNESDLLAVKHALESCDSGDYSTGNVIYPSFDVQAVNESLDVLTALLAAAPAPSAKAQDAKRSNDEQIIRRREIADAAWAVYNERAKTDSMLPRISVHQLRTAITVTIDAALSAQKEDKNV